MAEVIWTEPALFDLEAIADYIALENRPAAQNLVERLLERADQLADHPELGRKLEALPEFKYRELIEPPCRLIYRAAMDEVYILHVIRTERLLRSNLISEP